MSYGAVPIATGDHPYAGEHILTSKDSGKVVTFRNDTRLVDGANAVVHSVMLHDDAHSDRPRICLEPAADAGKYKIIQKRFYNIDANEVASYSEKYVKFDSSGNMASLETSSGSSTDSTWEFSVTDNGDGSLSIVKGSDRLSIDETADLNFTTTTDAYDSKSHFVLKTVIDPSLGSKYESSTLSLSENEWTNVTVTIDPIARKLEYHKNGKLIDSLTLNAGEYASLMKSVYIGRDPTDLLYKNDSIERVQVFAEKLSANAIGSLAETRDFDVQSKGNWLNLSAKLRRQSPLSGNTDSTHTVELYKNGALIGSKDVEMDPSADFGSSSAEIQIGKNFKGTIGQVKTFATALQSIDMKVTGQPDYIEEKSVMRPVIKSSFEDNISIRKSFKAKSIIVEVLEGNASLSDFVVVDGAGATVSQESGSGFGNIVADSKGQYTLVEESQIAKLEVTPGAHAQGTLNLKISYKNASSSLEQIFGTFVVPSGQKTVLDFSDLTVVNNVTGIHGMLAEEANFNDGIENAGPTAGRRSLQMEKGQKYSFDGTKLAKYDLTDSYMSAWLKVPFGFTGTMVLFEKGDVRLKAFIDSSTNELKVIVEMGSDTYESALSENVANEWVSVGAGFSKKKDEVYTYFKTLDSTRDLASPHEDMLSLVVGRLDTFSAKDSSSFDSLNGEQTLVGYADGDFSGNGPCVDHLTLAAGNAGPEVALQFFRQTHIPERKSVDKIDDGVWTHVAATYDGEKGVVRLYHDGEEVSTVKDYVKANDDPGEAPLEIASYGGSTITSGVQIADVNVFDYVATPTQVKSMSTSMSSSITTTGPSESQKLLDRTIFKLSPSDPSFGDGVTPTSLTYAGHRGVIQGGVSYDASTKSLGGFNSNGSYLYYSGLELDYTDQPHSVSVWLKMDSNQADLGSTYSKILSFGNDSGKNNRVGVFEMNQSDTWWGYYNNAFRWNGSEHGVVANKWHHYVFTYAGGGTSTNTVKVYVDGDLINISRVQGNDGMRLNLPKKSTLYLGSQYTNGGFAGRMGDMAIFSRELQNGEVLTLFNAGRQDYPA